MLTLESFTPVKSKDLLVKPVDYYDVHKTSIVVVDETSKTDAISYFEVIKTGTDVTLTTVGETVMLGHLQHTPPFEIEGKLYAVVSEDDVIGVLEGV